MSLISLTIAIVLGSLAAMMLVAWLQTRREATDDRALPEEFQRRHRGRSGGSHRHQAGASHRYGRDERERHRDEHDGYDADAVGTIGTLIAIDAMDGMLDGRVGGDHRETSAPRVQRTGAQDPETVPIEDALQQAGLGTDAGTGEPVQRTERPKTVPVDDALERAGLLSQSDPSPASAEPAPEPEPHQETGHSWGSDDGGWGGNDGGWDGNDGGWGGSD